MKGIGRLKKEIERRRACWLKIAALIVIAQCIGVLGSLPFYVVLCRWEIEAVSRQAYSAVLFFIVALFSGMAIVTNHQDIEKLQEQIWDAEDRMLDDDK